jgi:hypothetical protein
MLVRRVGLGCRITIPPLLLLFLLLLLLPLLLLSFS